jgi:hypothetical protein
MTDFFDTPGTTTGRISGNEPATSNRPKAEAVQPIATQVGHGWTGLMILKGTFDVSPLYKPALEQTGNYTVVYGDAQHGTMEFREVEAAIPRHEAVAHIAQKLPIKPFSLMVCGDVPNTMHVPARSTTVALWNQGQATPGFQKMIETLIQLNREPASEKANYAKLVRERVFDTQGGKYAVCLGYFSRHPRIVLATRNMEIYTWIVYYNGVYSFVWSTDKYYMDRVKSLLEPIKQNELFYLDIEMDNRSLLVVHPLFWITKFNKVMNSLKGGATRLVITSYFRNYLLRMNLTQAESFNTIEVQDEDGNQTNS